MNTRSRNQAGNRAGPDMSASGFAETLAQHIRRHVRPGERIWIIPHDHPDPDGLASAAAAGVLLESAGLRGVIAFSGEVGRSENRALLKYIRYPIRRGARHPRKSIPAVLVDTAPWAGNVTLPPNCRPLAVFDHHVGHPSRRVTRSAMLLELDSSVGATTTLLYRHLRAAGIKLPPWLATAMVYAIATETLDLSRDFSAADLEAYSALLPSCNLRILGKIRHAPLPRGYYRLLRTALEKAFTYGRVSWANLGQVDTPEMVAEVAEFLLRMERITWAFCTSIAEGRVLVSLRSSQRGARCGKLLKRTISSLGPGSAGGHDHTAAGYLEWLQGEPESTRTALTEALVRAIAGQGAEGGPGTILSAAQRLIE